MMTELAPQDKTGTYQRPNYNFGGSIGTNKFPIEAGRYQLYLGNPCPVRTWQLAYNILCYTSSCDMLCYVFAILTSCY